MLYSKHSFPFSKASLQTDAALQEEGQTSTFEKVLPKPAEVVLEGEVFFLLSDMMPTTREFYISGCWKLAKKVVRRRALIQQKWQSHKANRRLD